MSRAGYRAPSAKQLQAQCDKFNSTVAVGGAVVVELDGGERRETITTSEAQVLSGHTAVVWLKGVSGCYDLDRVKPAEAHA